MKRKKLGIGNSALISLALQKFFDQKRKKYVLVEA